MNDIFTLFDQYPTIPIGMSLVLIVLIVMRLKGKRKVYRNKLAAAVLDQVLLWLSNTDALTVRDLMANVVVFGRSGSAKTTGFGKTLGQAIVSQPKSAGLVVLPKAEDLEMWIKTFRKAGRKDFVVFDQHNPWRFNFLDYVGNGEARNVVNCLMMLAETLSRGERGGGEDGDYWKAQCERLLETAVIALQSAGERVTAVNLHRFIMTAATDPKQVGVAAWQAQYHGKVLERGHNAIKSPQHVHDYEMAIDFWLLEFPGMADRTRSSILTYATQILHVFNTGLCKEMVGGETNITPDYILNGGWVLVNYPPSMGAAHAFISTGWKYSTQLVVLKRQATESSPFVTIWTDEFQETVTSFDTSFIAQCRSHKGCLVALTQSVSSLYGAMRGETGRHKADALLGNFAHWVVAPCDPVTGKAAAAKLGQERKTFYGGSSSHQPNAMIWDLMTGNTNTSASFNQHMAPVLDESAFMVGRCGGPENGFLADAVVVKSGEPFSDGRNYKRLVFSQR